MARGSAVEPPERVGGEKHHEDVQQEPGHPTRLVAQETERQHHGQRPGRAIHDVGNRQLRDTLLLQGEQLLGVVGILSRNVQPPRAPVHGEIGRGIEWRVLLDVRDLESQHGQRDRQPRASQ